MAETDQRDRLDEDDKLFEESFLLATQVTLQRLLNEKQLKYRDLAKRLGVSEARVSHMFGDEASNLTIRTVARIYRQLGETPVILSVRDLERITAGRDGCLENVAGWTVLADEVGPFEVARAKVVTEGDVTADWRPSRSSEWMAAENQLLGRMA
ncbi:helix-turn-helix transcriptional regulator [Sphingomonas sp. BK580]|uniref:helix-turn-helix domain-containing protein n=1 Tax=Sphingomonas sp. BK580 TaxID=2586972 RepID=UPI00161E458E|nr:helix-turn-helix transcriptional regulator [Sphingomonas sp. BK580]MBB3693540.1 DNA-binding Xre family transcriptional regulator [Sphingomonas sp. BK580]